MEQKIKVIIQNYAKRLGILPDIKVTVARGNSHLASAQCASRSGRLFHISFDAGFLRTLDERELSAAIAHEIGHVWIYMHFPYLQTEALANRQALRLVSRNDLARVYGKIWKWSGKRENLDSVLGPSD